MTDTSMTLTMGEGQYLQGIQNGNSGTHIKAAAGGSRDDEKRARLQKACEDMESLFIHQLLKEMRAAIPKSDLFGKSHAKDIYTGMLDGRMAQEISQNRGLGISALLMRQLGGLDVLPDIEGR